MSGPNVDLHSIHHHIVKSAIEAMNGRNKKQWYDLFSDNPDLTDDGTHHDFTEWSERELFGSSVAYLASIDKVEDGGLMIYGKFHSDQWADFKSFMRFHVKMTRSPRWKQARLTIEDKKSIKIESLMSKASINQKYKDGSIHFRTR